MTYMTRFPINITRRESRLMLASPYKMHAAIAGCFPADVKGDAKDGRVLWRVDRQLDGSMLLYIVSPSQPSLLGLDEQIGYPDLEEQAWVTRDYDPFLNRLAVGQRYAFRLVANPVVSRKGLSEDQGASKRVPHLTVMQQSAWLVGKDAYEQTNIQVPALFAQEGNSRAERNGFAVCRNDSAGDLALVVSDRRKISFKRKGKSVTLAIARYDGVLEVTDLTLFQSALRNGIGHAKGFGCGLLTIVPCGDGL